MPMVESPCWRQTLLRSLRRYSGGVSWRGRPVARPTAVTCSPGSCHHGNPDRPVVPSGPWSPRTDLGVWTRWACLNWAPCVPLGGLPGEGLTRRRPWVRVPTPALARAGPRGSVSAQSSHVYPCTSSAASGHLAPWFPPAALAAPAQPLSVSPWAAPGPSPWSSSPLTHSLI